ncbi:class I SAM-dependent methyltransferase [Rhodobacteraceae bacterium D3-12]|nr:class I SAM-dependent methyltransferase [Rhodobacteraceae bacterium D3-12]
MSNSNDDLDAVYGLKTPEDHRRHYDGWADSYDSGFAADMDYRLPERVAAAFAADAPAGPVLDLGAGTGLVGVALAELGIGPVDGTDISPEMLKTAAGKAVYRNLFEGDILSRLPVADDSYGSAISTGTFTNGHVGPEAIDEVLRVVRPGGLIAISVNAEHWQQAGFEAKFDALQSGLISGLRLSRVRIYGQGATGPHANDDGLIVLFRPV